eukprot:940758_1
MSHGVQRHNPSFTAYDMAYDHSPFIYPSNPRHTVGMPPNYVRTGGVESIRTRTTGIMPQHPATSTNERPYSPYCLHGVQIILTPIMSKMHQIRINVIDPDVTQSLRCVNSASSIPLNTKLWSNESVYVCRQRNQASHAANN